MKNFLLLFILLPFFPLVSKSQCNLKKPKNLEATSVSSCDALLDWKSVKNAAYYQLRYRVSSTKPWTMINTGTSTSYTITGLLSDTGYDAQVATYCSDNTTKGYTPKITFKTLSCSVPFGLTASGATDSSAVLSWQAKCNASVFNLRYRISGTTKFTNIHHIVGTTFTLKGLNPYTAYDFELQSDCGSTTSIWSGPASFTTLDSITGRPNVLVILMDDGRYDSFIPTGGPSWFSSPTINSLAYGGVNFSLTFPGTSQCAPSRVSIYTGLYGHHNGCINNGTTMYDTVPLVQQILKDNGYYTGFVGKYGQAQGLPKGFNWWAVTNTDDYIDPPYKINGKDTTIEGNILDVYPELALTFLQGAPANKPWLLMFFTRAPHTPAIPRKQDNHLYENETMPFPSNFNAYSKNYPNFFNIPTEKWPLDSAGTDSNRLQEFQTLAGVEYNVDTLTTYLKQHGMLNNTLIFFLSDNGYLKGEHLLEGKEIVQEESIRLPFFVKYPGWFQDSTIVTSQMASNIDIAPTILEAAGIPNTYHMDGISLRGLVSGQTHRTLFFYEFGGTNSIPPNRAVRSLQYKYVHHYCDSVTEEFYDLVNDPHENTNQINNSQYTALIQQYKHLLDSLRTAFGDYDPVNSSSCYLKSPKYTKEESADPVTGSADGIVFSVAPNPAQNLLNISFTGSNSSASLVLTVTNVLTQMVYTDRFAQSGSLNAKLDTQDWNPGLYLITIETGSKKYTQKVIIER